MGIKTSNVIPTTPHYIVITYYRNEKSMFTIGTYYMSEMRKIAIAETPTRYIMKLLVLPIKANIYVLTKQVINTIQRLINKIEG